jgi:copper(I)-binding protein
VRFSRGLAILTSIATLCGISTAADASASAKQITITKATATAAKLNGQSAVVLTLRNVTKGPITLFSVKSSVANKDMIFYDTNMCQGNHAMVPLSNILITAGNTQKLGYEYQGAMLWQLKKPLTTGEKIPLTITWDNFRSVHTMTIEAKVIKPPKNIDFAMSSMKM